MIINWNPTCNPETADFPNALVSKAQQIGFENTLIPTYADIKSGNKPPVKEIAKTWVQKQYSPLELAQFPTMESFALYLGKRYIAIDKDGKTALQKFQEFSGGLSELPETLQVSSDQGVSRSAMIYELPEKFQGKIPFKSIPTGDLEQLEFRTGDHYQVIAGMHPKTGMYYDNGVTQISELPFDWCKFIQGLKGSKKPSETNSNATEESTDFQLAAVQQLLGFLETLESDEIDTDDYNLWLRVGMILHSVDESEAGLQIWDQWSQKSPKYDPNACAKKWASFDSEGDTISIGSLYFWLNKESEKISDPVERKEFQGAIERVRNSLSNKWTIEDTPGAIAEFKELRLTAQSLDLAIQRLALDAYGSASDANLNRLWDLYYSGEATLEEQQASIDALKESLEAEQHDLDVQDIIGDTLLGQLVYQSAVGQGLIPGYVLMPLITALASVLPKGLSFNFNQTSNTIPVLYTLLIGGASYGKGIQTRPILKPLEEATIIERTNYLIAQKKWKKELEIWKKKPIDVKQEEYKLKMRVVALDSDEDLSEVEMQEICCPEPPKPHVYMLKKFTPERARSLSGEHKGFGMLAAPDEFKLISNGSKYSGGKSGEADTDEFLGAYDGEATLTDLQTDQERDVDYYQMSIVSGMTRRVFQGTFATEDPTGFLSRCLFLPMEKPITMSVNADPDQPDDNNYSAILEQCYQECRTIFDASWDNKIVLKPTKEAKAVWAKLHHDCMDELAPPLEHNNEGAFAWLRRHPERVARIAMVLHVFRIQQGAIEKSDRISADTMTKAVKIGYWLISKAKSIYKFSTTPSTIEVDPVRQGIIEKIYKLAAKDNGSVSIVKLKTQRWCRDLEVVRTFFPGKGKVTLGVRELAQICQEMQGLGLGTWNPSDRTFTFTVTAATPPKPPAPNPPTPKKPAPTPAQVQETPPKLPATPTSTPNQVRVPVLAQKAPEKSEKGYQVFEGTQPDHTPGVIEESEGDSQTSGKDFKPTSDKVKSNRKNWKDHPTNGGEAA